MAEAPQTEISFGDWSAWVTIDKQRVDVFSVEKKADLRKTVGYIEAKDGQAFTVQAQSSGNPPPTDIACGVYVDGRRMRNLLLRREGPHCTKEPHGQNRIVTFDGLPISNTTVRPFVFSKPALTDDADAACEDEQIIKNLGTVQINQSEPRSPYILVNRNRGALTTPYVYKDLDDVLLNEKSKKVLSHQAQLGGAVASSAGNFTSVPVDYLDTESAPYFTLEFRYLSRELLEIQGHVEAPEKSPTPPPAPNVDRKGKKRALETITINSDSDDDDPDEEVRRLQARIAELQKGSGKRFKKEKEDVKVKREKGVKSETGGAIVLD